MPVISSFFGIKVTMYWDDHNPPHFHVEYGDNKAIVLIIDNVVLEGGLPNRQLKMILAWAELHREELIGNWNLARLGQPLLEIPPLVQKNYEK
jgi:hypothetical protein